MSLGFFATPRESIKSGKLILLYHAPLNSAEFASSLPFTNTRHDGPWIDGWQRDIELGAGVVAVFPLISTFYPDNH